MEKIETKSNTDQQDCDVVKKAEHILLEFILGVVVTAIIAFIHFG